MEVLVLLSCAAFGLGTWHMKIAPRFRDPRRNCEYQLYNRSAKLWERFVRLQRCSNGPPISYENMDVREREHPSSHPTGTNFQAYYR